MTKNDNQTTPYDYPVCKHHDCPMATTCLRQIAYTTLIENEEYLLLINPTNAAKTKRANTIEIKSP